MDGGLRAFLRRINGVCAAMYDILVKGVFDVRLRVRAAEQTRAVCLIVSKEKLRRDSIRACVGREVKRTERRIVRGDEPAGLLVELYVRARPITFARAPPSPSVAIPERRQQMNGRCFGAAVGDRDADQ